MAHFILDGTYSFPVGMDLATIAFLREAASIKLEVDNTPPMQEDTTVGDFMSFLTTAREATSFSKSGRHFSHYRASCNDMSLVELHVKTVNIAACHRQPLHRWQQGVTVLLEKVVRTIHIDRLKAICLLEVDFNWWLKVIFTKRMLQRIKVNGVMPIEHGVIFRKTTMDSSMIKQLFFDQANILHMTYTVFSTDAEMCFDAVNHAACSISLQAMYVTINLIT
jgi:hypothetical protein